LPRIVSYNVRHCRGTDGVVAPSRISEVIAGCRPDIIALQELDAGRFRSGGIDQAETIARDLNMNSYFHPALKVMDELYGDAILTALPSRLVRAGPLPGLRRFPRLESRGALWTEIQIDDVLIQIINTHLGLLAAERSAQTGALLGPDWLGHPDCRDPIILAADLNALPSGRNYRRLASMLAANDMPQQLISPATFPSRLPLLRIDHIIVSPSVQVQTITAVSTALSRMASDHLPLVADFSLVRSSTINERRRRA
jgi:endonuclease/exonuclease/phosphatase family metal-dependent hydrolase